MILSAGLSPAWQQILCFDHFQVGEVNRAREAVWCASGKVVNVAVSVASLGGDVGLISALGGVSGDVIQRELKLLGVQAEWIDTAEATRVCTTLLDGSGQTTELVENVSEVDAAVLEDFVDRTKVYAASAKVTVLTGSLPTNCPTDLFARILQNSTSRFLLDVRGESLQKCLPLRPFLIKPNREELQATVGYSLESDAELIAAMRLLNERGAEWVAVSDGARGVWLTGKGTATKFVPPSIRLVNPIGCGDALAAGIAFHLDLDDDVPAAVQFGMGAAADNAEQLLPARLKLERSKALAEQVRRQTILN